MLYRLMTLSLKHRNSKTPRECSPPYSLLKHKRGQISLQWNCLCRLLLHTSRNILQTTQYPQSKDTSKSCHTSFPSHFQFFHSKQMRATVVPSLHAISFQVSGDFYRLVLVLITEPVLKSYFSVPVLEYL